MQMSVTLNCIGMQQFYANLYRSCKKVLCNYNTLIFLFARGLETKTQTQNTSNNKQTEIN